jgi:hypothetical protein
MPFKFKPITEDEGISWAEFLEAIAPTLPRVSETQPLAFPAEREAESTELVLGVAESNQVTTSAEGINAASRGMQNLEPAAQGCHATQALRL